MSPQAALQTLARHASAGCPGSEVMDIDRAEQTLSSLLRRVAHLEAALQSAEARAERYRLEADLLREAAIRARAALAHVTH
ncbi:hypothetical protein [Meiothermus granaticius]|uniref:Uncharacterized protein n=1 Tax=Meiothermus granaticius NBRC 107808 TaxID=1227551 RepID=A0A399FBN2_9DEIN|nr:hypothetical protein [Meiothermus granaticius]RIH94007.1 hypothetical protein Mgrana_00093 [Meiothermus granaticius NBRC 107808]GEM88164.1 hypothetical protein MGR01S_27890 [Meiothermus granaticius NBRC 107808]